MIVLAVFGAFFLFCLSCAVTMVVLAAWHQRSVGPLDVPRAIPPLEPLP